MAVVREQILPGATEQDIRELFASDEDLDEDWESLISDVMGQEEGPSHVTSRKLSSSPVLKPGEGVPGDLKGDEYAREGGQLQHDTNDEHGVREEGEEEEEEGRPS